MSAQGDAYPHYRPDGRRMRWSEHRRRRRALIVAAGVAAIDARGRDANAEDIAAAAGLSRTALYRYFRDRDDLWRAIGEHLAEAFWRDAVPRLDATPKEAIRGIVAAALRWLDEHPHLYHLLHHSDSVGAPESAAASVPGQLVSLVAGLLTQVGLPSASSEPVAHSIIGMVERGGAWWLSQRSASCDQVAETLCQSVWHVIEGTIRAHGLELDPEAPLLPRTDDGLVALLKRSS
jgi:AcrR family transcriptional regulator